MKVVKTLIKQMLKKIVKCLIRPFARPFFLRIRIIVREETEAALKHLEVAVNQLNDQSVQQTYEHDSESHYSSVESVEIGNSNNPTEEYENNIKYIEWDIRELFFQEHKEYGFNRLDTIVRYLAIEDYYKKNDFGLELYKKMQAARMGQSWLDDGCVENFIILIKSYEKHNYKKDSVILLDSDLGLRDGSHRVALGLYHGLYSISCKVMPDILEKKNYDIDWFIENGFSQNELDKITSKYIEIRESIKHPLLVTLWSPLEEFFDEVTELLKINYRITSCNDYCFDDYTYAAMVRGIYAIDDIIEENIERKIKRMLSSPFEKKMRVIQLDINKPKFRLKEQNLCTLSTEGEKIKRVYRNAYKNKVHDYIHDILVHTGDNFKHTEHIQRLLNINLNVKNVIDCISKFTYVITKFNTPYMPMDFPEKYPLNKDIDIICVEQEYEALKKTILNSVDIYKNTLTIRVIPKKDDYSHEYRSLIRLELNNWLVLQFDIQYIVEYTYDGFIHELLDNRIRKDGFYILPIEHEIMIRLIELYQAPQKSHHKVYINEHIDSLNIELCRKYLRFDWETFID